MSGPRPEPTVHEHGRLAGHISGLAPPTQKKGRNVALRPFFIFLQIPWARRDT